MADPKKSCYDIITWAKSTTNDVIAKKLAAPRSISITNNAGTSLASGNFDGSANVTLKLPATVGIDISGNAATATKLGTANKGSATQPIYLNAGVPTAVGSSLAVSVTGNAATATKLKTARNIAMTGAVTGNGNFDGSGNLSIATSVGSVLQQAISDSSGCLGAGAFWEDGWFVGSWYYAHMDFNNNFRATKVGIPYGEYSGSSYESAFDDVSDVNHCKKMRILFGDEWVGEWNNYSSSEHYNYPASGTKTITFPLPFTSAPDWIFVSSRSKSEPLMWISVKDVTSTSFTLWWNGYNSRSKLMDAYWMAIGYID